MGKSFAAIFLAFSTWSFAAQADETTRASIGDSRLTAGDDVAIDEPVDGSVFVAAGRVQLLAPVGRSAYLTGGDVTVAGSVGRSLYAAGGDVRIESRIEGNARAAGGKIRLAEGARVDGDASFAGGSVEVDGSVGGDLRMFGESITLNGTVEGDAELGGESVNIGPDARIAGRVKYRSGKHVVIDPAAQIAGGVKEVDEKRRWLRRIGRGAPVFGGLSISFGVALLGALLILGMPRITRETGALILKKPLQSSGMGFVMLIGVPFTIVVLLVTVIGIPLALLVTLCYAVLLLLGYLITAIFLGDFVLGKIGAAKLASVWWRVLFMFLALIVLAIVKELPLIGGLAVSLLFLAGIGAFTMRSWQGFRRDEAAPA